MNDRFKFRFYHYETEKEYDVKALCFEGKPSVTVQYNPVLKFSLDSGELIQCTGLRDKNDELIYEGDIIKTCNTKATVVWSKPNFLLKFVDVLYSFDNFLSDIEVIGKINENEEFKE